jgi:rod shape-determining protein MreC
MNRLLFALPLTLLLLLSLPENVSDFLRAKTIAALKPAWKLSTHAQSETQTLQLENRQLRQQLDLAYEWLNGQKELKAHLQKEMPVLFGEIIYRDPASWSSSLWINVGEENNKAQGRPAIAKNSPVVSGCNLIGIVEYVGKHQSRVRLITDASLKIAVRAVRGSIQEREIAALAHQLKTKLGMHSNLKTNPSIEVLQKLESQLPVQSKDIFLAKGEIHGSSAPYFRTLKSTLKGIGFNCEFPDEVSPSLDLRSGKIIQVGDVLLTSGLDGVFPAGLKVASVSRVHPLREGAFAYELEALPAAGNFADLTSIFVLPSLSEE